MFTSPQAGNKLVLTSLSTAEKALAVLEKIVEISNRDWEGPKGNLLTISVGSSHNHVGFNYASFDELVNCIYNYLVLSEPRDEVPE